jgi:apolipoprotein N-acyltransferase
LRASRKTVIVGARVPTALARAGRQADFSTSLAVLRGGAPIAGVIRVPGASNESLWHPRYFNAMVVRGAQATIVPQRIPVPVAMWNPFRPDSAQLNLSGAGLVQVGQERVGVVICYEQLIVWPVLMTMIQRPTVLYAPANDYWATSTTIPTFQRTATRSWARLFGIPCLVVVNT